MAFEHKTCSLALPILHRLRLQHHNKHESALEASKPSPFNSAIALATNELALALSKSTSGSSSARLIAPTMMQAVNSKMMVLLFATKTLTRLHSTSLARLTRTTDSTNSSSGARLLAFSTST